MPTVSATAAENTRKNAARIQATVLQRLAVVTQERAAACMGVHASTVSRAVADDLPRMCQVLAACGLKVVERGTVVVEPGEIRALKQMAVKYLLADLEADADCAGASGPLGAAARTTEAAA